MGQILHGSTRTTEAVRRAIQDSQESIAKLAKRYGLNPNTVAKCKKRDHVCDAPMALKNRRSSVLSTEEMAKQHCPSDTFVCSHPASLLTPRYKKRKAKGLQRNSCVT